MADTPVDTVDTELTGAPTENPDAEAAAAADAAPEEKPAPKKAAAKKAAAKKPAAKKAAAKKTTPKKAGAAEVAAEEAPAADAAGADTPAEEKPAKKAAAKKTTAKKAAAKKTAAKKAADEEAATGADEEVPSAEEDEAPSAAAVLFQAPAKKPAAKRAKPKPAAEPQVAAEAKDADQGADEHPETTDVAEESDEEPEEGDEQQGEGGGTSSSARRRRRRGGRRRRKPAGAGATGDDADEAGDDNRAEGEAASDDTEGADDKADDKAEKAEKSEKAEKDGEQGEGGGSSSSSRRRRRRRREGEGGSDDDEPNTVTRVRKPRSPEDEITAVSGSTRLEAKKQRRREGREAGRRRAPIVSEAEFLARRESVDRVMVIRQRQDLTQIAVMEDKVLVEHYVARESQTSLIGNVYLGRVQNVLPSMEAAFIDIGKGRNAVLYAGEVNWSALGHKEGTPRKIESVLTSGQTVLVQVTKDPIGHKGARLTSQVSLAGRFLVYVPDGTTSGISRKLPDTERGRLKSLLKEIVPDTAGVIVRTAAEGASEDELTRDVERLKARWDDIEAKAAKGNAPQLLYGEPDLTLKVVRDLFTEDFARLVVQGADAWETVRGYVEHVAPDLADRLEHYDSEDDDNRPDVFAAYRIDEQIAKGLDRKVWLPSGGSLIIDRTEAMTVIDVNTGKFTGSGGNLEETVTKNNLEAAEEIVRQLRLRDIGGIIVVDFIDMVLESNRDLVLRRLVECLGRDRTRHQVAEVTSLGLVQMTRKRIGTGLLEAFSETCDHCQGRGIVVHDLPVEPRRSGGDDEARRGGRRRRGRGGAQSDEPAAKAVPSPKDVAAMAKPPAPGSEEEPGEAEAAAEAAAPTETPEVPAAEAPAETAPAANEDVAAEAEQSQQAEQSEQSEQTQQPEQAAEPEAPEVPQAPVEPAAPKVVTRTRRRAASRPAGPPASAAVDPQPEPVIDPRPEPVVEAQPAVADDETRDEARDEARDETREPVQAELPVSGGEEPVVGAIGAPATDGMVEPQDVAVEPGTEASADEPHVEHVPIKRKGTRKR